MNLSRSILHFAAVFSAGAFAFVTYATDWPQYRGPEHNGKTDEKVERWPANGPRQVWRTSTPNGFSSFVVKDGRAFTQIAREVDGVQREVLVALDAQTGRELWALPVGMTRYGHEGGNDGTRDNRGGDGPRSTPAIDGDRVYILSSDLVLVCYEAATGKELWNRDLVRQHKGKNITWKNAASPVIDSGKIFVGGGGEGQAFIAVDKSDGSVVWAAENDTITHATPVPATIHGVRQIIFFTQKGLVSLSVDEGKVLWRHPYRFHISTAASPVVSGDIVFCSAGYGVGATAVQVGKSGNSFEVKELWRSTGNDLANHWSTPIVKDGFLYGMFQFKEYGDGPIKCVELKSGKEMWSQKGFGPGNVILAGNTLVALSDAGQVTLVDPAPDAYKEVARFQAVSGKCWSTPAVANGRLYVRSTKEGASFDVSAKMTAR